MPVILPQISSTLLPPLPSTADSVNNPIHSNHYHRAHAFSNPVYPYHQPRIGGQPMNLMKQSTNPSPVPSNEDENELLRKYGLDRLNLVDTKNQNKTSINDNAPSNPFAFSSINKLSNRTNDPFIDSKNTNGMKTNGDIKPKTNNNWTTFD